MCATCGCSEHHHEHSHAHSHSHERELLAKNARLAQHNREALAAQRLAVFNLIGSPGAGKTALLEGTVRRLGAEMALAVLGGDRATDRDARRIEAAGCRALQVHSGIGCHLDASMIANALKRVAPKREGVVFVESVGNLVCPALLDLGERAKVVLMSVTDGEDQPMKYPHIFKAADLFVLNKIDLQPLVQLDVIRCFEFAKQVNPKIRTMRVSARTGQGIDTFCAWIRTEVRS